MNEQEQKFIKLAALIVMYFVANDAAADFVEKTTQIARSPEEALATMSEYRKLNNARAEARAEIEEFLKNNL